MARRSNRLRLGSTTLRGSLAATCETDGGTRIGEVWNTAAGSVSPYSFPAVVSGVHRDDSLRLVHGFLERHPGSPFAAWARTLA